MNEQRHPTLFFQILQSEETSSSELHSININTVYEILHDHIRDNYQKAVRENNLIAYKLDKILDNWDEVKKFHFSKSPLFNKLQDEFELDDLIQKNSTAKKLINHLFSDKIEQLSSEFMSGVGGIQADGAHLQLSYKKSKDEECAIEKANIDNPFVTGLDHIDDLHYY